MSQFNNNMNPSPEEERKMFAAIAASYAEDVKREEHYRSMIIGPLVNGCIWMGAVTAVVALMAVKPHYDWWDRGGMIVWAAIGLLIIVNNILCVLITKRYFKHQIEHHLRVRQIALSWKDNVK
jgi:hypothetical protein